MKTKVSISARSKGIPLVPDRFSSMMELVLRMFPISVKKYDFTNPIILSDADLSKLKTKSEQFVYYLAGHLSMFLRTEFNLEMDDLNADLYANFTQSVKTPSCVTLFKLQELNGVCLLDERSSFGNRG